MSKSLFSVAVNSFAAAFNLPSSVPMEHSAKHVQTRDTSEAVDTSPKDCLSCRIMGAGLMAGTGSYAIWQSRAAAPGSPAQKKVVAGFGLGENILLVLLQELMYHAVLLVGSVFRWRQWK
jgi:hypothetical protein